MSNLTNIRTINGSISSEDLAKIKQTLLECNLDIDTLIRYAATTKNQDQCQDEDVLDPIITEDVDDIPAVTNDLGDNDLDDNDIESDGQADSEVDLDSEGELDNPDPPAIIIPSPAPVIDKIKLNIGGKHFNLKKILLDYFGISYTKLHKSTIDDQIVYFLDRDPHYFGKIIELIKMYGLEESSLIEHMDEYSDQFINELCYYGLLDKKYNPRPKIKLTKTVSFPSRHNTIVKIIVDDQQFETTSEVLSRSKYFNNKLKLSRKKIFNLTKTDPKVFRYVINFLRTGELYVNNIDIIEMLHVYGIDFEKIENKKIDETIVSYYLPNSSESIHNQINGVVNTIDLRFIDKQYYQPQNLAMSCDAEAFNVITTNSKLEYGSKIIFDLTNCAKGMGSIIEDLVLCIDIPVLSPTEPYEYVDNIEYKLVEYIDILLTPNAPSGHIDIGKESKIIMHTNADLLYLCPIIYTNHAQDYHAMTNYDNQKTSLLYENTLIEVKRITIPLFLLKNRCNHLPIKKIVDNNMSASLILTMASTKSIFKTKPKDIPLLNVSLIANFVTLVKHITVPSMYIYDRYHTLVYNIQTIANPIYDVAIIPLDKFGLIKEFFFVIMDKSNAISNKMNCYSNNLIEMEILQLKENQQTKQKTLILHTKLDSVMLNYYIPIKKLGHKLPVGIYYYSFSADPSCSSIRGGLYGNNYMLHIKVKKMDGVIKLFVNEYRQELI